MKYHNKSWLLIIFMILPLAVFSQEKYSHNSDFIFTAKAKPIPYKTLQIGSYYKNNSFYKVFNPMTKKTEELSDKVVINDANFDLLLRYGLSKKFDLSINLPFESFHKYSPMGEIKGSGINDAALSVGWNLLNIDNHRNYLKNNFLINFPTGSYDHIKSNEIPLGLGCYSFKEEINGFHKFAKSNIMYSVNYTYRTKNNSNSVTLGDEVGGGIKYIKDLSNKLGHFGFKGGFNSHYKFDDELNGKSLPNDEKFVTSIADGIWYSYSKNLIFSLEVPITVYKNEEWFTDSQVIFSANYFIDFNKKK